MEFLFVPLCYLSVLGTDEKLSPETRLETGAAVANVALSADGNSVLGIVEHGNGQDLVAWDVRRKTKTALVKGAGAVDFSLSPDGRTVLTCTFTKPRHDVREEALEVWDLASNSRVVLQKPQRPNSLPAGNWQFSGNSAVLAIADANSTQVRLWKRRRGGQMEFNGGAQRWGSGWRTNANAVSHSADPGWEAGPRVPYHPWRQTRAMRIGDRKMGHLEPPRSFTYR